MPPSIQQSNAKHHRADLVAEVKEFDGPHLLPGVEHAEQRSAA
jgi:hypothetical protein